MEYPEGCSTAIRYVARKVATVKGRFVWFRGGFTAGMLFPDRWTCIWQYSPLRTEPSKSYWVYLKILWWYLGQQYINRKGSFCSCFCIIMSCPTPSDISQDNTKMLEKQCCEMQWWHEEEQQSLLWLQKTAEVHCAEHIAQKARREAEIKAKKEAERQRVVEEEERKKRMVEYLQRLRDEVLEEEATLLEGAEGSQVAGSKRKEVAAGGVEEHRPSKKARGKQLRKYCGGATVKMGGSNPCKRCVCAPGSPAWYTSQGEYLIIILMIIFLIIFFFIVTPLPVLGVSHSSSGVYPTPITILWPWFPLMAGF